VPWGLVGAVAAVVGVEAGIARLGTATLTSHELDWRAAGNDARRAAARADVLLLGDSMVKFGVNPAVLEAALRRPVYCLALLNGRPAASYFLLRRTLEAGGRPRVVVVDYQPECMLEAHDHLLANREWKVLLAPRECAELAWVYGDPDFFTRTALARLVPSVMGRETLRSWVAAALLGRPHPTRDKNARVARNRAVNRGGMLLAPNPAFRGDVPERTLRDVADPDWFHRPAHTDYVRALLRLAGRYGVPVVWLLPPNAPRVEQQRARLGVEARYTRFVRSVQAWDPSLTVVDVRRSGFDATAFVDAVHLNRDGAAALSLRLAEVLRGVLDGPRPAQGGWVALPPPDFAAVAGLALEDVTQSQQAVQARASVRR
jgi:hypothetical protein